jgi:hypothetical protein
MTSTNEYIDYEHDYEHEHEESKEGEAAVAYTCLQILKSAKGSFFRQSSTGAE